MKKIAVVLLNWNGITLLQQFLPTVVKYSAEATIYIADNASTDESKQFVNKHFKDVKWIQLSENYGYAKGYNEALRQVDEEYLCLLNTDIEVTEHWLQPIINLFDKKKDRKSTRLNSSHVKISYAV